MTALARRLKKAMAQAGFNQADLARASGCSRGAISLYLSGQSKGSARKIKALADALGLPVEQLIGADPPAEADHAASIGGPDRKITLKQAAHCLRLSEKVVAMSIQNGSLPIGRAFAGTGSRLVYLITPEKLKAEAGESRFNEFFGLTDTERR